MKDPGMMTTAEKVEALARNLAHTTGHHITILPPSRTDHDDVPTFKGGVVQHDEPPI